MRKLTKSVVTEVPYNVRHRHITIVGYFYDQVFI